MKPMLRAVLSQMCRHVWRTVFAILGGAALLSGTAVALETTRIEARGLTVIARYADTLEDMDRAPAPQVEVRAGDRRLFQARFPDEMGRPALFVTEMDPANSRPEVVVEFYSGGAHCCESIDVLEEIPGRPGHWQTVNLGWHDGGERPPKDLDGDGLTEIVTTDESFLYAYGSYAESYAPPVIMGVRQGRQVDLTRRPSMRSFLRREEKRIRRFMRDQWRGRGRPVPAGILAGYVALKILLGEGPEGWRFMLANLDPATPPTAACPLDESSVECPVPLLQLDFPAALALHLRTMDYVGRPAAEGKDR